VQVTQLDQCADGPELIKRRGPVRTLTEVELGAAEWIDWYNNRRLHGEIATSHRSSTKQGYLT
jgi:hypothetical protein